MKVIRFRLSNDIIVCRKYVGADVTDYRLSALPSSIWPKNADKDMNAFNAYNCEVIDLTTVDGRKKEVREINWFSFFDIAYIHSKRI